MNDYHDALAQKSRLHEYEIVRVLGRGGFGITYLAYDHNLDRPVALKEYLPRSFAARQGGSSNVVAQSRPDRDLFEWGLVRFSDEAQTLGRFKHPNLIAVYRFFPANGTGYIVMEYAEGKTLSALLQARGRLTESEWLPLLLPL